MLVPSIKKLLGTLFYNDHLKKECYKEGDKEYIIIIIIPS